MNDWDGTIIECMNLSENGPRTTFPYGRSPINIRGSSDSLSFGGLLEDGAYFLSTTPALGIEFRTDTLRLAF